MFSEFIHFFFFVGFSLQVLAVILHFLTVVSPEDDIRHCIKSILHQRSPSPWSACVPQTEVNMRSFLLKLNEYLLLGFGAALLVSTLSPGLFSSFFASWFSRALPFACISAEVSCSTLSIFATHAAGQLSCALFLSYMGSDEIWASGRDPRFLTKSLTLKKLIFYDEKEYYSKEVQRRKRDLEI